MGVRDRNNLRSVFLAARFYTVLQFFQNSLTCFFPCEAIWLRYPKTAADSWPETGTLTPNCTTTCSSTIRTVAHTICLEGMKPKTVKTEWCMSYTKSCVVSCQAIHNYEEVWDKKGLFYRDRVLIMPAFEACTCWLPSVSGGTYWHLVRRV